MTHSLIKPIIQSRVALSQEISKPFPWAVQAYQTPNGKLLEARPTPKTTRKLRQENPKPLLRSHRNQSVTHAATYFLYQHNVFDALAALTHRFQCYTITIKCYSKLKLLNINLNTAFTLKLHQLHFKITLASLKEYRLAQEASSFQVYRLANF